MPDANWNARAFFKNHAATLILAAVIVVITIIWLDKLPRLEFQKEITRKVGDLIVSLLALALFVERSLSIVTDIWLGEEREKRERAAAIVAGQAATTKREIEAAMEVPSRLVREQPAAIHTKAALTQVDATVAKLNTRLDDLKKEQITASNAATAIECRQDRVRLAFGFLFALLISAVGVRVLGEFVTAPTGSNFQKGLFNVIDIVITAGIIAGGSTGINSIADVFGKYADALRKRAETR
jgi:hypothetical protein